MKIVNYGFWLRLVANAASARQLELRRRPKLIKTASVGPAGRFAAEQVHPDRTLRLLRILCTVLSLLITGWGLRAPPAQAQDWFGGPPPTASVPTTATAQRGALNNVRAQVSWLQNATRAANGAGGADMIRQQFQRLREAYDALLRTLNQRQLTRGANELTELSAGLDIIQEVFANYDDDIAAGRDKSAALNDLCQVLREASNVWLQKVNQDCRRLQIGT